MNEDDPSEIDLPFSQYPAPVTWGFLFVGGWEILNIQPYLALGILVLI